jgi:eukaryotic-like serine/threonine-protein kinase
MAGPDRRGDELIGKTLGHYLVEYRLGSGATGVVFRGKDTRTDGVVALKVLNENLGTISSLRRRFEREARLLTKLEHPNIVHIHELGVQDTYTFIAMELLEGRTLEEALDEAPLPPSRALEVMTETLRGLAFAHDNDIVHRDLKPANVFLCRTERNSSGSLASGPAAAEEPVPAGDKTTPSASPFAAESGRGEPTGSHDGRSSRPDGELKVPRDKVKLLDFGLAKLLSGDGGFEGEDGTLTRKGRIVGTPAYMAPEQITGVSLDVRADVYAAGILLFELLADRRPFLSDRRSELLRAHLLSPPPPLSEARPALKVHPELEGLVRKALEKNPNDRFPNAQAMLEAMLALPRRPARLASSEASPVRSRSGATSEIISSSERRAVSESVSVSSDPAKSNPQSTPLTASPPDGGLASLSDPSMPPAPPRGSAKVVVPSERDQPTGAFPAKRDERPSILSTPMLYVLALLLFAIAGVLWMTVGPR